MMFFSEFIAATYSGEIKAKELKEMLRAYHRTKNNAPLV